MRYLQKLEEDNKKIAAYIYMTICSFSFAVCALAFELLPEIPAIQIILWRCTFVCSLCYIAGRLFDIKYEIKDNVVHKELLIGSFLMTPSTLGWFYGLKFMPMSECIVLDLTAPIASGILGVFMLKEQYTLKQFGFASIGMLGVILVSRPSFLFNTEQFQEEREKYEHRWIGALCALAGGVLLALQIIFVRKQKDKISHITYTFYMTFQGSLILPPFAFYEGFVPIQSWKQFLTLFLVGFSGFIALCSMSRSAQLYDAGKVTVFYYNILIFSLIFDATILNVYPVMMSIYGSLCILIASIGSVLIKEPPKIKKINNKLK